jgi:Second Messenger Oligonucleotide or Dinucleotide Synthetase domain
VSNALLGSNQPHLKWIYLVRRFERFVENLAITDAQLRDGTQAQAAVRTVLNRHYWGVESDTAYSRLIGSWDKQLRVRPPRDVDVMFSLPWTTHARFEERVGNWQSQLLQDVRGVLGAAYPQTTLRGDGQVVVVVAFAAATVEVVPAFEFQNGQYWICDTNDGGRYVVSDPAAELSELEVSDLANGGATRRLTRILKQWQRHCDVPIKSFQLERLATLFLREWSYSRDLFWIDWMVRDFLAYLLTWRNRSIIMPRTGSAVALGEAWDSKAQSAHRWAVQACDYERDNENVLAGLEWQSLFGSLIPLDGS